MSTISIRVIPNAKMTGVAGRIGTSWKIRLAAPPVDGRANDVLIAYLAEVFDCPKREISLVSGAFSRLKTIRIPITSEEAEARLNRV